MTLKRLRKRIGTACLLAVLTAGLLMLFAPDAFALFSNGGFEAGNLSGWTVTSYLNTGLNDPQPFTGASITKSSGGTGLTSVLGPYAAMSHSDPNTGGVLHYPLSGSYCAVANFLGNNQNANTLSQQDTVTTGDVDPVDNEVHVNFAWAAVVQNPGHTPEEQPYVYVSLKDVTTDTLLYETFIFAGSGSIWQNAANSVQFTDWQEMDVTCDPSVVGDTLEISATAAGCSLGGHWGYVYVDHFGSFFPVTPQVTAADKAYDGTTAATITGRTLTGVASGADVSLTGGTATFDTAAVGSGKTVTATGFGLSGADAGKYALTSYTATTTASIYTTPTVTTSVPSSVTATSAAGGGNVTSDGDKAVTARGVCWSTSANPTTADSHTTDGTGTGTFTSPITGLHENATYHVRAYATNAAGTSYGADETFTTTFTVSFVTDGTSGASLTGSATQSVPDGGSTTGVTATAPLGYHFVDWTYGSSSSTDNPLTLGPVAASVTVTAHFAIDTFTITVTQGAHGTITPGSTSVDYGADEAFVITPDVGYHIAGVTADGAAQPLTSPYIFSDVSTDHSITASFAVDTYTLTYAAGAHGSLTGDASQSVDYGGSGTAVTAVAGTGYHFVRWSDGVLTASRTDSDVSGPVDVTAQFAIDNYLITASAGPHGSISPDGAVAVDYGADRTFTITPDAYYKIADVLVDGESVGAVTSYTVSDVTAVHTIVASFAPLGPPTTKVTGLPSGWVHRSVVRLDLVATPAAGEAPIAYTEYRIGTGPWVKGTTVSIKRQGVTTISCRSVDTIGNVEAPQTYRVSIDRTRPKVSIGGEVNVNWGQVATFSYRLRDNIAKSLDCRLVITFHGKVVAVERLGKRPVGRRLVAKMLCRLPIHGADAYGWRIEAEDAAGNRAAAAGGEFEVWLRWFGNE